MFRYEQALQVDVTSKSVRMPSVFIVAVEIEVAIVKATIEQLVFHEWLTVVGAERTHAPKVIPAVRTKCPGTRLQNVSFGSGHHLELGRGR